MNKNEENKKNNIIIGIGAFGFAIVIAIIAIGFFTPKAHAQVLGNDLGNNAVYALNKTSLKPVTDVFNDKSHVFKPVDFVSSFQVFGNRVKKDSWKSVSKADDKNFFTFAFAKAGKFSWVKQFDRYDNASFPDKSYFEKKV